MDLNLSKVTADYGGLGQWRRNLPTSKGLLVGPVPGDIRINYPSNNLFVPAAVLQDEKYAMGICRLGVHDVWRTQFGELTTTPKDKKYRLRFSEKRTPGPAGTHVHW
jgi:hypothetical protein